MYFVDVLVFILIFTSPNLMKPMKNSLTNELFCSTFGHNFYHSKSLNHSSDELICKNCNTKVISETCSDLDQNARPKKEFRSLLFHLYTLTKPNLLKGI